jgi:prevent-host-death family protein
MAATRTAGLRELKKQTSRILREVIDRGEPADITHRGRTIARIVPVAAPQPDEREPDSAWTDLVRLAAEIGTRWPEEDAAVDAVREGRREL